jgi:hypothetical protein
VIFQRHSKQNLRRLAHRVVSQWSMRRVTFIVRTVASLFAKIGTVVVGKITMFFNQFETLGIECDAPPYGIVRACHKLGFLTPEDVRWCSAGKARKQQATEQRGGLLVQSTFNSTTAF